ncbi:MAG: carbamoyl-phosphate synthase large subunit [Candidatus Nanopelagicaceae bacterium]|nr:carbamoyl-phosphate synthase large subunit [Candidatus Nanopelagicaceae bacterium]
MPRLNEIKSVLVIGSGPIVIGQACEFDYSGTQACRVLQAEGIRVILINSNPATIMTDPEFADATYIEPITPEFVEKVIAKERPDAILATLGGQTALNAAISLHDAGILDKYKTRLIGANVDAIRRGEDRQLFKEIVASIGGESAGSMICHTIEDCYKAAERFNYPVVVRPSFTMGGLGSGIAYTKNELTEIAGAGLRYSPTTEVLIEESILGWKEFELEMMRDYKDNVVVVCSIENFDPMGVHTGDSITVAPAMTLTDVEYQKLRDLSIGIIRAVGVDTGGCNIQFAVNPADGRIVVIEMNPRVSRSSALASKATGFPIAKIAAKLAIGYSLDEIKNDITQETPASFEPTLDYVVVKVPRFNFEKFPAADNRLTTTMKSVGEAMAIGRSFPEALQKALRSLEKKGSSFSWDQIVKSKAELLIESGVATESRIHSVQQAMFLGATVEQAHEASFIDLWFLAQIEIINKMAHLLLQPGEISEKVLRDAKRLGFSDLQIAQLTGSTEEDVRKRRSILGMHPVYKTVDTCAAEFKAMTPYHYSSYDYETEVEPRTKPAVIILGSGPNRIGQGVEFDYSCVHAAFALRAMDFETIMINCNPETVSTDYDTSDRLYFEPLTFEDVMEVYEAELAVGPIVGVVVQLGGQTPLGLAARLQAAGVPIVGTSPAAIDIAEDRGLFGQLLKDQNLRAPKFGMAGSFKQAQKIANEIGYPVLARPSYVLGGRGMEIVYDEETLAAYISKSTEISLTHPVMIDKFLDDAIEVDVDALFDGEELFLGGVMEHIEEAGVHSGDSACVLPPTSIDASLTKEIREATKKIARGVGVKGLINIQFAIAENLLYVLEANPRASRTVPFVSKATGISLAKCAAAISLGKTIADLREEGALPKVGDGIAQGISVKEAVLPWNRFRKKDGSGVDSLLGPEMRSTGEVMGRDDEFGAAFSKSQSGALGALPISGAVFASFADRDKGKCVDSVKALAKLGFEIVATAGTAKFLAAEGIKSKVIRKYSDGLGPKGELTAVDSIESGEVALVINTPFGSGAREDGWRIRTAAVARGIPIITTIPGLKAAVLGIAAQQKGGFQVKSLQDWLK